MSDGEDVDFADGEAEESSDGEGDSSSEDSEEEEDDEGEAINGLIDDNPIEESGSDEEDSDSEEDGSGNEDEEEEGKPTTRRKRDRSRSFDDRPDDEDYALIAENTGIQLQRKKFRRVHGNMLDSDDEDGGASQPRGVSGDDGSVGRGASIAREESKESAAQDEDFAYVFGGDSDEEEDLEVSGSGRTEATQKNRLFGRGDDGDEYDDFIVDDFGQPIRRRKEDGTFTEPMLAEAQEVFGLDFDMAEFEQVARNGLVSDEEELEEEVSDDEETPRKTKKSRMRKKKSTIYEVYEPSELERGHFLERDTEIKITDKPERFQLRSTPVRPSEHEGDLEDDVELKEEAEWIYNMAFVELPISKQPLLAVDKNRPSGPRRSHRPQHTTVPKIKEALNFMKNHSLEVPFIASYRREYVEPELNVHDLWRILYLDEKWSQLQVKKKNMKDLFERMRDYQFEKVREKPDTALTEDMRVLTDEDMARLDAVTSDQALLDVYAHFLQYYGRDLVSMQNSSVKKKKRPDNVLEVDEGEELEAFDDPMEKKSGSRSVKKARRKDFYSICQMHGLGSLAAKFGLTAEQFGENMRESYQRHETEQHHVEPEVAAEDYKQMSGPFTTIQAVLEGACHMVAMQISAEPLVRKTLRQVFRTRAMVSVKPTKKGRKMIDDSHNCISMKYLRNKPVRELKGDEFLRLHMAEQDHLLEIKISIDGDHASDRRSSTSGQRYFEEIRQLFYRDEYSMLVEKWNAQRAKAVAHALLKVLYPLMAKELRLELLKEAKEQVLQSAVGKFRKWLDVAPLSLKDVKDQGVPFLSCMACAYTHDKDEPSFFVFLDGNGEVTDFARFNNLAKRKYTSYKKESEDKQEDLEKLKNFIMKKEPHVIAVSAESRDSVSLVQEIQEVLREIFQESNLPPAPVELVLPHVPRLFSKSRTGKEMFPDYPESLKMSISVGRMMQEPLVEYCSLVSSLDDEVFSLPLHPLQGELPPEHLKKSLEEELVTRVNDMGVDIQHIQEHSYAVSMLHYVCGLGPRKAAAILKTLKQEMVALQNRSQLVTQCSMGPQVFMNSSAFLKVTSEYSDSCDVYIEPLDSTRVHPENYEWARKMAEDALDYDENDVESPNVLVEDIMRTPDKLRDLDLDAFAEELARQGYGNKRMTLYDIRNDLSEPFKEKRQPFTPISQEELFTLFTGETEESLYEGRLFTCAVVGIVRRKPQREVLDRANPVQDEYTRLWKCPFCSKGDFRDIGLVWQHFDDGSCPGQEIGVRTRLENGLSGFILTRNLSDKPVNSIQERVHVGMTIYARVKTLNKEKYSVDMTSRSSDLADREGHYGVPKDPYYDHGMADRDKRDEAHHKKPSHRPIQRVITHPAFQNITFEATEKFLASMEQGEAVFRPSTKSMENLTLTWKVDEGIYQHVDIQEKDKPNKFSLGKSLLIGRETYEDLDEILARYVQPMAAYAKDLLVHKYYRQTGGNNVDDLKKLLRDEKLKNPKRIPYFFCASKQLPGKFYLAYQPGSKPKMEYVTVTSGGFRYRGRIHDGVDRLIGWFKDHYQDPVPRPPTTGGPGMAHQ